jgi:SnoaL-like protein
LPPRTDLILERTEAISHILGQSLIRVDGETAAAETCFLAFMRLPGQDGAPSRMNQLVGRFVDRLERIDGVWKIRHRICVRDTSMTSPIERDDYAAYGFVAGTRDGTDPGAALIGIVQTT